MTTEKAKALSLAIDQIDYQHRVYQRSFRPSDRTRQHMIKGQAHSIARQRLVINGVTFSHGHRRRAEGLPRLEILEIGTVDAMRGHLGFFAVTMVLEFRRGGCL